MPKSSIDNCLVTDLPKISDRRGNLTFIEADRHVPFEIKRVYYLYDVPGGADRGGHAHKQLSQFLIAISGSFDIHLDDGRDRKTVSLNRSYKALRLTPFIWREIDNFSSGAVCLVLASRYYDPLDYIRDYQDFLTLTNADVQAEGDAV